MIFCVTGESLYVLWFQALPSIPSDFYRGVATPFLALLTLIILFGCVFFVAIWREKKK